MNWTVLTVNSPSWAQNYPTKIVSLCHNAHCGNDTLIETVIVSNHDIWYFNLICFLFYTFLFGCFVFQLSFKQSICELHWSFCYVDLNIRFYNEDKIELTKTENFLYESMCLFVHRLDFVFNIPATFSIIKQNFHWKSINININCIVINFSLSFSASKCIEILSTKAIWVTLNEKVKICWYRK